MTCNINKDSYERKPGWNHACTNATSVSHQHSLTYFLKNSLTHLVLQWLYVVVHMKSSMQENPYNNLVIFESYTVTLQKHCCKHFTLAWVSFPNYICKNPTILQSATTTPPPSLSPREKDYPPAPTLYMVKKHIV